MPRPASPGGRPPGRKVAEKHLHHLAGDPDARNQVLRGSHLYTECSAIFYPPPKILRDSETISSTLCPDILSRSSNATMRSIIGVRRGDYCTAYDVILGVSL